MEQKQKEKLIRLASLVGTDAKNPEQKLLDYVSQLLQADSVSRDALYIGAEIRWAGMTPLERAEAIELGWHPSNYLKEIKE